MAIFETETKAQNKPVDVLETEIDVTALVRKLLSHWKTILLWCLVAAVIGIVFALTIPNEYTVKATLAPESTSKGSSGNLGSLASLAGINLSAASTPDALSPDLYPVIISSKPFLVEMASLPVSFLDKEGLEVNTDLYTYWKDYYKRPWWSAIIKFPKKALKWVIGLFKEKDDTLVGEEVTGLDPFMLTPEQSEIIKLMSNNLSFSLDKKTSVLNVRATTQSKMVSAQVCQALIDRLLDYLISYRTGKARNNEAYYQKLYDESKEEYYEAQKRYARYVDAHQSVVLASVRTEQERLQNEMSLKYQLYNSCAQQLQVAKAKLQEEIPVFQTIDPPSIPNKQSKPSRGLIVVLFVFLGGVASSAWILLRPEKKKETEDLSA